MQEGLLIAGSMVCVAEGTPSQVTQAAQGHQVLISHLWSLQFTYKLSSSANSGMSQRLKSSSGDQGKDHQCKTELLKREQEYFFIGVL